MRNRKNKTVEMLSYNIEWNEVAVFLDISVQSLIKWRNGDNKSKHEAIDYAVSQLIDHKRKVIK